MNQISPRWHRCPLFSVVTRRQGADYIIDTNGNSRTFVPALARAHHGYRSRSKVRSPILAAARPSSHSVTTTPLCQGALRRERGKRFERYIGVCVGGRKREKESIRQTRCRYAGPTNQNAMIGAEHEEVAYRKWPRTLSETPRGTGGTRRTSGCYLPLSPNCI